MRALTSVDWHFGLDGTFASARKETPSQQTLAMMENAYLTLMGGFTTVAWCSS